jgi:hypothetical protein
MQFSMHVHQHSNGRIHIWATHAVMDAVANKGPVSVGIHAVSTHAHVHMCALQHVHVHVRLYVSQSVHTCLLAYTCMHVYMHLPTSMPSQLFVFQASSMHDC